MNVFKNSNLLHVIPGIALVSVALTGCATGLPEDTKGLGTTAKPYELVIFADVEGCPTGVEKGRGYNGCRRDHPRTLCARNGQSIRWTTMGNNIEQIEFKDADPMNQRECSSGERTRQCPVSDEAKEGVYWYSVKLEECKILDPKIIVTK